MCFTMEKTGSLRKVVVHMRSGEVIPGFASEQAMKKTVKIVKRDGSEASFELEKLKAVFFVKDFEGNPEYHDVKFLNKQHVSPTMWVRLEFFDGEMMEGKVPNNIDLLRDSGFFLWPSDPDTNNDFVYVVKSSLKGFTILSPA